MKPEIQEHMETNVTEVRNQNTLFDTTISVIEEHYSDTMNRRSATTYDLVVDHTWLIAVSLNEDLYNGTVIVAINKKLESQEYARFATMTITSSRTISEALSNVDNVVDHTMITELFGEIFTAVINANNGGES